MRRFVASLVSRRLAVIAGVSVTSLFGLAGSASGLPPSAPATGAYVTDGPVQAIAHAGGRTYIGGAFNFVGRRSGSGAILSSTGPAESSLDVEVAGGDVHAAISDHNGGWYIGGSFTAVGGQTHVGLAHLKDAHTVDSSFNAAVTNDGGIPAPVYALALDGGTLYVGGQFSRIGVGTPLQGRRNIAALNAVNGAVDPNFSAITDCSPDQQQVCDDAVRSLALAHVPVNGGEPPGDPPQPVLFVGGDFVKVGAPESPKPATGIAALWGVGAIDPTGIPMDGVLVMNKLYPWAPSLPVDATRPFSASVRTIQVGPQPPSIGACPDSTSSLCSFMRVYLGGWGAKTQPGPGGTSTPGPLAGAYEFVLNKDSRLFEPSFQSARPFGTWTAQPLGCQDCAVNSMVLQGSTLYFGGGFTQVGNPAVNAGHLATIPAIPPTANPDTFTANATPLGGGVTNGTVHSLAFSASSATTLLAAGDFSQRIMAVNSGSGAPVSSSDWTSPAPDSAVHVLATDAANTAGPSTPSLYAGGAFRSLGAVPRHGLAAFDSSGALLDWAPDLSGGTGQAPGVHAMAASGSTVYVGGQFGATPGPARAILTAVDAASGNVTQTLPEVKRSSGTADVLSLSLLGSTLYVGGAFDQVGDQARKNLAALDAGTGAVNTGWNPGANGNPGAKGSQASVHAILPGCGAVYVGGWFDQAGGQPRENLAALDPSTGAPTSWDPGPDGSVLALARYGSAVYAGGTFGRIDGTERQRLAALNASDGHLTAFDAGIDALTHGASIHALAAADSALYLGGYFATAGGEARANLAAVNLNSGQALGWDPRPGARVDALTLGDGAVYAGGAFESVGATGQRGFAGFGAGAGSPFAAGGCPVSTLNDTGGSGPPAGSPPPFVPTPRVGPVVLRGATVRPTNLVVGRGAPLTVRFVLSRASRVRLLFERQVRQACRRTGRAVVPRRRVCMRYVRFATVTARGRKGANRVTFAGLRIAGRRLVPGRYRVVLQPLPVAAGVPPSLVYFQVRAAPR